MTIMDKKPPRVRLDSYLAEKGISASREKARSEIVSGWVKLNGETVRDPAKRITGKETVTVERPGGLYVSRGGEKLARALDYFGIELKGVTALDLGASTGGFTDCMLKRGAVKVYALDVGYNQLDYSLRKDARVVVMEKTHARDIHPGMFEGGIGFFTADLSFISILKVLPAVSETFSSINGVVLVKPQFEADPSQHKKGVVRDPAHHAEILGRVIDGIISAGFAVMGLTFSPVKGPAGNIEFLVYLQKYLSGNGPLSLNISSDDIKKVVDEAHRSLNNKK